MLNRHELKIGVVVLLIHTGLLMWNAWRCAPTIDEPANLAAGLYYWKSQRFDLYEVNPPLTKLVAAFPAWCLQVPENWAGYRQAPGYRSEWKVGDSLMQANGSNCFWLITISRWACLPFSILGAWCTWRWARELFGIPSGLVAVSLWSFSPCVLGHGSLVTADAPAASAGVLLGYTFWQWLRVPAWTTAFQAGVAFGLCLLVKSTWLIWLGVAPVAWLIQYCQLRAQQPAVRIPSLPHLAFQFLVGLSLLNLGYAFEGTGRPLGDYVFASSSLSGLSKDARHKGTGLGNRFAGHWIGNVPVPLPESFVVGIDLQRRDFEGHSWEKFLLGEVSNTGWWYFYIVAAAVKIPLGVWVLAALGVWSLWSQPQGRAAMAVLVLVPLTIMILVSSQYELAFFRYVLPAQPYLFIIAAAAFRDSQSVTRLASGLRRGALAWAVGSSLLTYPYSLAYFNEIGGGWRNGHKILVDSNCDWGQELLTLKRWLAEHPEVTDLKLLYVGGVDPRLAEMDFGYTKPADFDNRLPAGWYAVSASAFHGIGYWWNESGVRLRFYVPMKMLADMEPVANLGGSILVYHVPESLSKP